VNGFEAGVSRTCYVAEHQRKRAEGIVLPDPRIVTKRFGEMLEVCLLRKRELPECQHRPWIAEDVVGGFVLDRRHDVSIGESVRCFHEVG
jgi:hypothetical protein